MIPRTSRTIQRLAPVLCVLLLNGCLFETDHGTASQATPDANAGLQDGTDPGPMPPPFSTELAGVIQQPVRWASCDVRVKAARVVRGLNGPIAASYGDLSGVGFGPPLLNPRQIYVVLDLKLDNKSGAEVDYTTRNTWDLLLANGLRVTSVDALGVNILPRDTVTTSLHYQVEDKVDLRGAKLVLNGPDRETLEPEQVPLDRAYVQEFPRRIVSMVGQTAKYHREFEPPASVHVDEAVYDVNNTRDGRTPRGKRIVWLKVAFTALADGFFNAGDLRIVVDGRASAPEGSDGAILDSGVTQVFAAEFEIDETAKRFEVMIPDGTAEGQRFAVNVADTVLATDIP